MHITHDHRGRPEWLGYTVQRLDVEDLCLLIRIREPNQWQLSIECMKPADRLEPTRNAHDILSSLRPQIERNDAVTYTRRECIRRLPRNPRREITIDHRHIRKLD